MSILAYLNAFKEIQKQILELLESNDYDKILQSLSKTLDDTKICANKETFQLLLHLIFQIGDKHPHTNNFFDKISQILKLIKSDIIKCFSADELLTIFGKNKRLVLILIDEHIITVNEEISKKLDTKYFVFEKKPFISESEYTSITEKYPQLDEKRRLGENDNEYEALFRKDDLDGFIQLMDKNNDGLYSLRIRESLFESNSYFTSIQIINYVAAYGSLHIFQYLADRGYLTSDAWKYAIYGRNKDIIAILEKEEESKPRDLISSVISTHNNEFVDYLLKSDEIEPNTLINYSISSYNFQYIDKLNENFISLCEYDYKPFYKSILESKSVNVNDKNSDDIFFYTFF